MPATNLDRVKQCLRIPAGITVHDTRLTEIVEEVDSDLLARFRLTAWDATTRYRDSVDILPGSTAALFLLRRHPINSIVALTASGAGLVQDEDYRLDPGGVVRMLGLRTLDYGRDVAQIEYTAGHVTAGATPGWLLRLATLSAALQYNVEPQAGIGNLRVDPVQKVLSDPEVDQAQAEIARILARWCPAGD